MIRLLVLKGSAFYLVVRYTDGWTDIALSRNGVAAYLETEGVTEKEKDGGTEDARTFLS